MKFLRDLPLRRKLLFITLATSLAALVAACAALIWFQFLTFRQGYIVELEALGEIIAGQSVAPLSFDDADAAREVLASLQVRPHVTSAKVFDSEGRLFASYGLASPFPAGGTLGAGVIFDNGLAHLKLPVHLPENRLARLEVQADFNEEYRRLLTTFIPVLLVILTGTLLIIYLATRSLQRLITGPIETLVGVAGKVSEQTDFQVRAREVGRDELGLLTRTFNHMLDQIQARDLRLRESERRFRSLVEDAPVGVWQIGPDGDTIQYLNPTLRRLLEIPPDEDMSAKHIGDFIAPESSISSGGQTDLRHRSLKTGYEIYYLSRTGQRIPVLISGSPVMDSEGRVTSLVGMSIDITGRKQTEEALSKSEFLFRTLAEKSPVAIFRLNAKGECLYVNDQFERITGQNPTAAVCDGWLATVHPADRLQVLERWNRARAAAQPFISELRFQHPDGRVIWGAAQAHPELAGNGTVLGHVGTITDVTQRLQAEQAQHDSEQRIRLATEATEVGIWEWNIEAGTVRWDAQMFRLYGMAPTESGFLTYDDWRNAVVAEDLAPQEDILKDTIRRLGRGNREFRIRRRNDGEIRFIQAVDTVRTSEQGLAEWVLGTNRDITAARQSELALAESERFARASFDALSSHIAVLDASGCLIATNRAWLKFAEQNDLSGSRLGVGVNYLAVCEQAAAGITEAGLAASHIRDVFANRRTEATFEYACHSPAEQRWFLCRITRFPSGGPVRVVIAHDNITQIKQAEAALRSSENQFRVIWENSLDGMRLTDEAGTVRRVNQAYCRIMRKPREELELHDMAQPYAPERREEVLAKHSGRFRDRNVPPHQETEVILEKGRTLRLEVSSSFLELPGQAPLLLSVFRDVTERRQLERQAQHTQRLEAIGTLAGGVAHDLNNALVPITMSLEILKADYPAEAEMLETVAGSARRAADMVRQLLTFAKGAEGERTPIQLRHIVKEMDKIIHGTFPKNISLQTRLPRDIPSVLGDGTQIHQVLLNLCVNARDAMPAGGTLTMEAGTEEMDAAFVASSASPEARPGSYAFLRVTDTGTGIPPETLEKIFDPFFTTKDPDKGTGLGLSTALGITRSHGGFILVKSRPGEGSSFTAYFPVETSPPAIPLIEAASQEFQGNGELVLYVDDEAPVRSIAESVLKRLNFTPIFAADGMDGLIQVAQHRTSLRAIISDMHMPGMDGLAFARTLRRIAPNVPVIIATGRLDEATQAEFKNLGIVQFLNKPYTQQMLVTTLRNLPPRTETP